MAKESSSLKMLITGSSGKLGRQLRKVFAGAKCPERKSLDIRNQDAVRQWISKLEPEVVIHAAALTGIRQCEEDQAQAWETNVSGTEFLLKACKEFSPRTYFVYISTACVFYGDRGDYAESDLPHPKNYYSLTKLLAETATRNSGLKQWLIIRTNFVPREKWPYPAAFTDRFGTYLYADELALAIKSVLEQKLTGILHVCGTKRMSMYELARLTTQGVKPMTMSGYSGPPLTVDMTLISQRINAFELSSRSAEYIEAA